MAARDRRSSKRGAIMVEAIIVISFFILCFASVGYFRALYTRKLEAQRLARAAAIAHAMGACNSDPRAAVRSDLGTRQLDERTASGLPFGGLPSGGTDHGSRALQKIREKNGDTGLDEVTTMKVSEATRATEPDSESGFHVDVSSTAFVVCADPTPDDRYEGMAEQIAKLF
ncbi:MAG TPA: hypothetical protein VM925_06790 [Labilithrix sp.]|nr:hypothetical protein [Labilithrix sp.]